VATVADGSSGRGAGFDPLGFSKNKSPQQMKDLELKVRARDILALLVGPKTLASLRPVSAPGHRARESSACSKDGGLMPFSENVIMMHLLFLLTRLLCGECALTMWVDSVQEVKNGRLAMIAMIGLLVQTLAFDKPLLP
jgi:hypothetical protein